MPASPPPAAAPDWPPTLDTPLDAIARHWLDQRDDFDAHALDVAIEVAHGAAAYALAATWLQALIDGFPDRDTPAQRWRLVGVLLRAGDDAAATEAMRDHLRRMPEDWQGWTRLAEMLARRGDSAGALAALAQLPAAGDRDAALSLARARILLHLHKPLEARAVLEAVPRDDPAAHADACRLRAQIASSLGQAREMAEAALEGLAHAPGDSFLLMILARGLAAEQDWAAALPVLDRAAAAGVEDADFHYLRSAVLLHLGRLREALATAQKAVDLSGGDPAHLYHAAGIAMRLHDVAAARALLDRLLEAAPTHAEAWLLRVELEAASGQRQLALDLADRARETLPGDERLRQRRATLLLQAEPEVTTRRAALPDRPLPRRPGRAGPPRSEAEILRRGLAGQMRALQALVGYRIHHMTQFSRFGLLSAVLEPMLHMAVLAAGMYYFNHGRPPLGKDLFFFYATGVLVFLAFAHVTQHAFTAYREEASLLQVPQLRRVDLVLSVAVAHLVVDGIACFVVLGGMVLLRDHAMVDDWWTVAAAFLGGIALGTGLALLGAALNSVNRGVQKFWVSAQRLLYMISGVFYLPMHMPEGVREWMTLNPVLHLIEWFRHGVFPQYEPPWLSPLYVLQWAVCLIVLGLMLEVALRRHVRP